MSSAPGLPFVTTTCLTSLRLSLSPNRTPPPTISTLSLHDALPISSASTFFDPRSHTWVHDDVPAAGRVGRSEEHTSVLQSRGHHVWRLLLEKKKRDRYPARQYQPSFSTWTTK